MINTAEACASAKKHYIDVTTHKIAVSECNLCRESEFCSEQQSIHTFEGRLYCCYERETLYTALHKGD